MAEIIAKMDRLRLRTWGDEDEVRFYKIMNTPGVMRWLGGVQSPGEWNAGYCRLRTYQRDLGFTFWLIERNTDDEILGFCGLKRANAPGADAISGEFEIGWRLREDAWGQGFAKEAAIASLDLAFDRFDAPRVVAVTAAGNSPSQGLMKRLGMHRREELDFVDQRFSPQSEVNPQVVYVLKASDWRAGRMAAVS